VPGGDQAQGFAMSESSIFMSYAGVAGEMKLPPDTVEPGPGQDWIQLLQVGFSADVNVQGATILQGLKRIDFGGAAPPVAVTMQTNAATPGLMRDFLKTGQIRDATIVHVRTDQEAPTEYLRYELRGVQITEFRWAGGGEDRANETYFLLYKQLTMITFGSGHGAKRGRLPVVLLNGA
jgi:type VI protein secretion system component Hcp